MRIPARDFTVSMRSDPDHNKTTDRDRNDCHSQYMLKRGTFPMQGSLNMGGYPIINVSGITDSAGVGFATTSTVASIVTSMGATSYVVLNPTATQTITSGATACIPLRIVGHANQTEDLFDCMNEGGTRHMRVDKDGKLIATNLSLSVDGEIPDACGIWRKTGTGTLCPAHCRA